MKLRPVLLAVFSSMFLFSVSGCFIPTSGNYEVSSQHSNASSTQNYNQGYQEGYNQAQQEAYQQQAYQQQAYQPGMMPPPPPPMQRCGMDSGSFNSLKHSLEKASFRDDQKRVIESAAPYNTFWVSQVIELMNIVSFDDVKVDIAAMLYPQVCDANNWFQVYDALTFSSSKSDLRSRVGQ